MDTPIYDGINAASRPEQPPRQLTPDELAALDRHEPDPPEFDRSLVPDSPYRDHFFSGRTGRGLTDEEWDEQLRRDPALAEVLRSPREV